MKDLMRISYDPGNGEDIPVLSVYLMVDCVHELEPKIKVINTLYGGAAMEMYLKLTNPGQCNIVDDSVDIKKKRVAVINSGRGVGWIERVNAMPAEKVNEVYHAILAQKNGGK